MGRVSVNVESKIVQNTDQRRMNTLQSNVNKIKDKVTQEDEMTVDMGKLQHILKKRKNWSTPGINGIQNLWWK